MQTEKKQAMKKSALMKYVFYVILIVVTACITVLIMVLLSGEESKSRMEIEYDAEQIAALVVEEYLGGSLEDPSAIDSRIKGFGIYNPNGAKLFAWGNAPATFTGFVQNPGRHQFLYSKDGNTLTLVRGIGAPRMMWRGMKRNFRPETPRPQPIVYMVFDASGHFEKSQSASHFMRIIPFITILLMAIIGFLYAKNIQYRKKLETQSELEKLGEIARTLAHEIKNPLGAMQIHIGYLKKTLPAIVHGELGVLDEEISRLNLLTHRISDFVRDPVGSPEDVDLSVFIGDIARRYKSNAGFAKIDEEDYIVRFDRDRLRSVLDNLITNGLESYKVDDEEAGVLVEITLGREKGRIVLCVMDRGEGIVEKARDKVFDPFYSTKTTGSGIGLAISKRFVETAGGTIGLYPRDGGGTVAKVVFHRGGTGSAHTHRG
jgi:two-component system sensor histidine kinase HydH